MQKRPVPAGFAEDNGLTIRELIPKYHCSQRQIERWRHELGLPRPHKAGRPRIPCEAFDLETGETTKYESLYDAAIAVRGATSNIYYAIKGRYKQAYGKVWKKV